MAEDAHYLNLFSYLCTPMTKYIYFISVSITLCFLTGCSLFRSFSRREVQPRSAQYDSSYGRQVEDMSGWQSYNWHNDAELVRLHEIADSLEALGEKVPEEVQRRIRPKNYVETLIPQICNDIVQEAQDYIGCPYGAGQMGPKRFDCSGFTTFIFQKFGFVMGRSSRDQFLQGHEIYDPRDLHPADLVFWTGSNPRSAEVGHVGIVVDVDDQTGVFHFIHAASTGIQIDVSTMDYFAVRYRGARRMVE